jgi:ABC-type nitrate/sulfonate/bicarbonate transport system substrate-binding protein
MREQTMSHREHVLTTLTRTQGNNRALKDGTIRPVGFTLAFEELPVLVQGFRRMVRGLEFDVSEMALTTFLTAREHGVPFTAVPVFLVRGFHHGAIRFNTRSGIRGPGDLEGRRVGVNRGYTVTTGVWARGILADEHGLAIDRVTWVLSGDEHVESYRPPSNVVAAPPGADLATMLIEGEIDAAIGVDVEHPDIAPLIRDPERAALSALKQRSFYPINHLIVIKDQVLHEFPHVARAVFDAFAQAKDKYVDTLRSHAITTPTATDALYARVSEAIDADPLPYGIEPNRHMLELLVEYGLRQGILTKEVRVDDLFAVDTRMLTG